MKTRLRFTLHGIFLFFLPRKGYKRPKLRAFPDGTSYVAAGAYPVRRAARLP